MQTTQDVQILNVPIIAENGNNTSFDETVKVHKWTRDEYYKMAEYGLFEGKRVELIEGEIIEMAAMKSTHATSVSLLARELNKFFDKGFDVRNQLPLSFGKSNEPEPDFAIVKGEIRDFAKAHPKKAELIIEISDSTLSYDRNFKAKLYAKNKIQDYWILDVNGRRLEVYRKPKKDKKLGFIYSEITIFTEDDKVSPLVNPKVKIKIADILP